MNGVDVMIDLFIVYCTYVPPKGLIVHYVGRRLAIWDCEHWNALSTSAMTERSMHSFDYGTFQHKAIVPDV